MLDIDSKIARLESDLSHGRSTAAGYYELGGLKLAAGDAEGAILAYRRCLAGSPAHAALYNNLGSALLRVGQPQEAIDVLRAAQALEPHYLRAAVNLGKALTEVGLFEEAGVELAAALGTEARYLPALVNFGALHLARGALQDARAILEQALTLDPDHVEARCTLGLVYLRLGEPARAVCVLRAAIALAPQHPEAHSNLAHVLFVSGDWVAAWPHFEHRFRRARYRSTAAVLSGFKAWNGAASEPQDEPLWLCGEQGLGDQLQFVRYAKLLQMAGHRCTVLCEPRLVKLLSLARLADRVETFGVTPAALQPAIHLMSLPAWHATRPQNVPAAGGYLVAEEQRVARWRALLPKTNLRVALVWSGNPAMETGVYRGRSPPIESLAPLMAVPNVHFVSLQKGTAEEMLTEPVFAGRVQRCRDLDAGPDAFLDSAAVLKCVDLLITSDTAMAHLAGALAVPTWLCLMREPDWRWMRDGDVTPWYDSLRLFRQPAAGDWASVYRAVARELKDMADRRQASEGSTNLKQDP